MPITLEKLEFSYPDLPVLQQASWTFTPGLHVVSGDSGVGKTTLLRLIAGLLAPDHGRILQGDLVLSQNGRLLRPPPERGIMLMTQDNALWPGFSAAGNVRAVLRGKGHTRADADRLTQEHLTATGAADLGTRSLKSLSGGQARRVELARAMAADCPVLLLDEPFTGLNAEAITTVSAAVESYAGQASRTVILCTHQPATVNTACSSLVLKEGRLCAL